MAITEGVITKLGANSGKLAALTEIATPADGIGFALDHDCQRAVLIITETGGSADSTYTVEAADSFLSGPAYKINAVALAKGTTQYLVLESARYKNLTGANKGKIIVKCAATGTVKAGMIALPM